MGGGVLLTEIHEIDLAIWYFGMPKSVVCIGGTYSDVGMDVEDTVRLTLDYTNFSVQINLTFWQKHHERTLSISGEEGFLSWNQDSDLLKEEYFNETKGLVNHSSSNSDNDVMFDLQIKSLIESMSALTSEANMSDSIASIKIVEAAKKSMLRNKIINLIK